MRNPIVLRMSLPIPADCIRVVISHGLAVRHPSRWCAIV
ncbi:hypothetical protein L810_6820 [Burkholderia sp. AU4i]|nr:hypothetical protein L810_6820 [Burkholderia sp. AU4i]